MRNYDIVQIVQKKITVNSAFYKYSPLKTSLNRTGALHTWRNS